MSKLDMIHHRFKVAMHEACNRLASDCSQANINPSECIAIAGSEMLQNLWRFVNAAGATPESFASSTQAAALGIANYASGKHEPRQ